MNRQTDPKYPVTKGSLTSAKIMLGSMMAAGVLLVIAIIVN